MEAVIGTIVREMMEFSCNQIGRHMAYWVGYKKYIKELDNEAKMLKNMWSSIQGRVEIARNNGEVLVDGVGEWVEEVERKLKAVEENLEGQQQQLSCLCVGPRHRLGRRAEREKEEVGGLKARGDPFVSGTISNRAPITCPLDTDPTKYERFGSRDVVYDSIMKALRDEGDGSYKIGIGGLPGVGKTKMAFEVAKQALDAKIFDEVAKATVSQTPDSDKIRQDLADCLNLRWNKEQGSVGKAGQLGSRLKNGKRILLVLDDVWDEINLMEIGIPDNIKGCKVLITSREGGLWDQMGIRKPFGIKDLLDDEAWELFRKKVGDSIDQPEIHGVAKQVCGECGGLPLVILVVGGALIGKEKHVWDDTLRRLINFKGDDIKGMKAKVYKSIALSYEYLNPDPSDQCDLTQDQQCFLHCCLFAEDAEISVDDLLRYGLGTRFLRDVDTVKEARNRVHSLVDKLKVASLLLQGKRKDTVKMHDVIRDVGISIASKFKQNAFLVKTGVSRWHEKDRYDCYGTISVRSKAIGELPDEVKHPNLLTLVLASEQLRASDSNVLKVSDDFFKGLEKLKVLDLTRFNFLRLSSSLQNLTSLRMLSLSHCYLVSLNLFGGLHKLEVLCLNHCRVVKPPTNVDCDIVELAVETQKLTHLRILDFSNIKWLRVLPTGFISNLSHLEELYIYEFNGWEVEGNTSPLELNSLADLSTLEIHLQDVKLLPKDLHFELLNRFKISIGYRFDYKDYWYLSSISRALKLKGIPLKVEFNTLMERAQALSFIEINGLEKVLHDKDLPDLEYLRVKQCNDMEHLLGKAKKDSQVSSTSFSKLSVLKVSNCKVRYLFCESTAKQLQQLQELIVKNCEVMEGVIGDRDDEEAMDTIVFNELKSLELKDLPKLKSICAKMKHASSTECNTSTSTTQPLFTAKVSFPALEKLNIERLDSITVILERQLSGVWTEASQAQPPSLNKLRELTVTKNCKWKYLFSPSIARILQSQLRQLIIKDCESMEAIIGDDEEEVTDNIIFHQLVNLELWNLPNLRSISAANMEEMSSTECNPSTITPPLVNAKFSFPALETTEIKRLESISVILMKQLLPIGMEASHVKLCSFSKLSDLRVEGNCKLRYLFSPSVATLLQQQLKQLIVKDCENMEALIGEDEEEIVGDIIFGQLSWLVLVDLPNLNSIFANTRKVTSPTAALPLFNAKVSFPALEAMEIERLDSISEIFEKQLLPIGMEESHAKLCSFSKLSGLTVNRICKLRYLFSPSVATLLQQQLKRLFVIDCENMEALIGEDEEEIVGDIIFGQLSWLELVDLPNLKSISAYTKNMTSPTTALPLFNAKVRFPSLETLVIDGLDMITAICEMQLEPNQSGTSQDLLCSFKKLSYLRVSWNCKLKYLFSHSMDDIIFYELKELRLKYLPNLKSIFANTKEMSSTTCNPSTTAATFFHAKVSFPVLEVLSIKRLDSTIRFGAIISSQQLQKLTVTSCEKIEELIAIESGDKGAEVFDDVEIYTFTQLQKIKLDKLPKLERLFFSYDSENKEKHEMDRHHLHGLFSNKVSFPALESLFINEIDYLARLELLISFQKLQELTLTSCEKIQEIVAVNVGQRRKEALDDEILVFTRLDTIKLENLPNLRRCLGCSLMQQEKAKNDTTHMQTLFDYKVSFPVLRELSIYGLKCIMAINRLCVVKNGVKDSFPKLKKLHVKNCENMETIVVVEVEAQGGEANENVMVLFAELKNIRFEDLPNFKTFCSSGAPKNQETLEEALFNFSYNVQVPHLEMLYIKGIDNVKEIWQSTVSIDSVSELTELTVQNCDKLLNIGPLKLLKNLVHSLVELEIMNCPLLQDGFKIEASNAAWEDERVEKDEGVTANVESSVAFRRLERLGLSSFDSLLPFSKGKDSFPELKTLKVSGESMLEDIWEGRVPEDSFLDRVTVLKLEECSQLVDVPRVLQRFEAVEDLTLTSCSSVQVVFNLQELHAIERLATLSGQVERLTTFKKKEERLTLEELPKLEHTWLMKPKGGLVLFSNLTELSIKCCNNLRYLFSISIARALSLLKRLNIERCDLMEEIVMIKNEERGEANVADEIVFPKLECMCLEILPELTSFCGENNAFQFPSLRRVVIEGCPKLYTFTCGPTGMRKNEITCSIDGSWRNVGDINEHVRWYAQRMRKLQPDSHWQEQR